MTLADRAAALDDADALASYRALFVSTPDVVAYLDGNSLGRPLRSTAARLAEFVGGAWGDRLIRSWDESWMSWPTQIGDRIGASCLGAAAGQSVVADSTSVMLYKLARAALAARPGRTEIVADVGNFPTDRFVLEGIAAETGASLCWLPSVSVERVQEALSERTALALLSHVDYRSAEIADLPAITAAAHSVGALVLWDLCHAVGAVPLSLDADEVDLAVGCTYKYLNGGPGSPAFGYVAAGLLAELQQPIQGWMGAADPFAMGPTYVPSAGIRRLISGSSPILGMLPMQDMLSLIEQASITAIRAKSEALTSFAIEVAAELLAPFGVVMSSPAEVTRRGGHVMLDHPSFREVTGRLWQRGVIPDFRPPTGLRLGLSPLSTSFTEVLIGLEAVAQEF